jgi:hypothetical protein
LGAYWKMSWPEIVAVTQPPEATVRYEWMEHLIPRHMAVDRPDRVLVIGTVEDYTTVKHKVWENQLDVGDMTQLLGWFTRRITGHPLEEPKGQPYVFTGFHQPLAPHPFLLGIERGAREVKTEEWGKLKGYPSSWGTTLKDRWRIIQEPSLHFWSFLGDPFAPNLIQPENTKLENNEEYDDIYTSISPLSPRPPWEEDSSYDE